MFWRKKKATGKTNSLKLGKVLHELVSREVFGFLDQKVGEETLRSFDLDRGNLAGELVCLGQFAALSILKKSFPDGNEDVMAAMQQAYHDELRKDGLGKSDITEMDSYLYKKLLALSVLEAKLSDDEFNEKIGKLSAISVSESDPPPEGLPAVLLIYYNAVRYRVAEILSGVQLESVKKDPDTVDEIAADLSVDIFNEAISCADSVDEFFKKENIAKSEMDPPRYTQTALEFIFLFLHMTDRIAFEAFEPEKRSHFMDVLVFWIAKDIAEDLTPYLSPKFRKEMSLGEKIKVSHHYRTLWADKDQQFSESIKLSGFNTEELNARNSEYSNYEKRFNKPFTHTLFWEFGGHISEVVYGDPSYLKCVTLGIELAGNSFAKLGIHEKLLQNKDRTD